MPRGEKAASQSVRQGRGTKGFSQQRRNPCRSYGRDELLLKATPHPVRVRGPELSTEDRSRGGFDRVVPLPEAVEPDVSERAFKTAF